MRRGKSDDRPAQTPSDLPQLPELRKLDSLGSSPPPPPPVEKDSVRSESSSTHRPVPPPKESVRRLRTSTLHLVSTNAELLSPTTIRKRRRSRWQHHPIVSQFTQMKQWLAKRAKSPGTKRSPSTPEPSKTTGGSSAPNTSPPSEQRQTSIVALTVLPSPSKTPTAPPPPTYPHSRRRSSVSPAPITPHASIRRSSTGLRGRKSTSSSISSVRSIHHRHSHSKASSTSSNSLNGTATKTTRSPRTSVKVLPATPTAGAFPSNIRLIRGANHYNEAAPFGAQSPGGLVFAKRKKRPFKGPTLNIGATTGLGGPSRREASVSRSGSAAGRRSGEIIEEEDEEDEEEEVEEVDVFSPVVGPGEVEEAIEEPRGRWLTPDP